PSLQRPVQDGAELPVVQPVNPWDLRLVTQRARVLRRLAAAPRGLAVLAGGVGAPLHGALFRETARALEEELRPLAAAQLAGGTRVARHRSDPPLLGRPAAVVRDRRDVADRPDLQPRSGERLDRRLATRARSLDPDVHPP